MSESFLQCRCPTCPRLRKCFSTLSNLQNWDTTELMPYQINTLTRTGHLQIFIQQSQLHWSNYPLFRQKGWNSVWLLQARTTDVINFNTCDLFLPDCWRTFVLGDAKPTIYKKCLFGNQIRQKLECLLRQFTILKMEDFADKSLWNGSIGATASAAIKFANMLEQMFTRNIGMPMGQPCLTKARWGMAERTLAVARLKAKGLVAEFLHHAPEVALDALLHLFRTALLSGGVPETRNPTTFNI